MNYVHVIEVTYSIDKNLPKQLRGLLCATASQLNTALANQYDSCQEEKGSIS